MNDAIREIERKTNRYYYEDGLIEMGVGVVFTVTGALLVFVPVIPPSLTGLLAFGLPIFVAGGTLLSATIVNRLKQRIVYPRTGYVAHKPIDRKTERWIVIGGAVVVGVAAFFLPQEVPTAGFGVGAIMALVLGVVGGQVGLRRLYIVAGVAVLAGVGFSLLGIGELLAIAGMFVVLGIALTAGGLIALISYLRSNPHEPD
jgi:hypothetical protein